MCTTSYVCMQVSRNLAENNTPQLCLPNAQISDFLTFWGTRDFIIAVSSQSRRQHIACVAADVPPRSCPDLQENHLQAQAVIPSILLRYLSAYRLVFGFNSSRQFTGYVFLLQVKSAMIIFVFLLRESRSKACLFA